MVLRAERLGPSTALWVVPVGSIGGVGRHVLDVVEAGLPGLRLVVLCPPGPLARAVADRGGAVVTGPVSPDDGIPTAVRTVRATIARLAPEVVHTHLSFADLVGALATLETDAVLVTTEHGIADDDLVYHGTAWRGRIKAAAHTLRLRRADAIIAVAEATERSIRAKWHPSASTPITVVYNGVDAPQPPPESRPGLRVCSIARLAPEKRIDHALRALSVLRAEHPEATMTIAGDGPEGPALRALAADLGLHDAVAFVGHVDPVDVLAASDVLVQLSIWENCSYSLLDALSHGLGVVATAVGGNPEILPGTALVAHDDAQAVAAAIEGQGLHPPLRPTLAADWPTRAEMCAAIVAVYRRAGVRL